MPEARLSSPGVRRAGPARQRGRIPYPRAVPDRFHQTIDIAGHAMPGSWAWLLPEDARWLRLPRERFAACAICPPVQLGDYEASCRCCGYLPQMTNFAVGLALRSPGDR